jgi:hypothetical protein
MHPEILTPNQHTALAHLGPFASSHSFYLGGGTAIALYLGHRRSDDFDWFIEQSMGAADRLATELQRGGIPFSTESFSPGTLYGTVSGVRTSFIEYGYPLLRELQIVPDFGCQLASLDDLAAMKLAAITQRGSRKDFLDIFELGLKHASLQRMLEIYKQKYGINDIGHVLLGLAYFDEAEMEPMPQMLRVVKWDEVKKTIQGWVKVVRSQS